MEASHKTHRPHIKVGKDEEEEEEEEEEVCLAQFKISSYVFHLCESSTLSSIAYHYNVHYVTYYLERVGQLQMSPRYLRACTQIDTHTRIQRLTNAQT